MKNLIFVIVLISIFFVSCFREITTTIPCDKFKDHKETIKKVFSQQYKEKSPNSIEITDNYIAWGKQKVTGSVWTEGVTTLSAQNTIYFDNIEWIKMGKKKGHREIRIKNKANRRVYIIFLADKDLTIQGYSAIKCMIEKAMKNKVDGLY